MMTVIANMFRKLKTVKTWFDHSLKSAVSEHALAVNMLKGHINLWNLHESTFVIFFDRSDLKDLENISHIEVWNLKGVY